MPERLSAWILAFVAAGLLGAAPQTAREIDACTRAALAAGSSVQIVHFRSRDRQQNESRFDAKVYWKRFEDGYSRVLMRVTAPPETQGTAILWVQKADRNDIFMYAPELKRVRRVTNRMVSSSVLGTDFSYEDFQRLQGLARDGRTTRLPDEEIAGRPVWVIEAGPERNDAEAAVYVRVRSWVDQATCVPLRVEYFEQGAEPRKVLVTDPTRLIETKGHHLPQWISMTDRRQGTTTELEIAEIELGVPLRRSLFGTRELEFGTE